MPTNDERRQVAARLRNALLTEGASKYAIEHDCEEHYAIAEVVFSNLRRLLGFDENYSVHAVANRLADLIEPEERTCRVVEGKCDACGFKPVIFASNYCPNCGARVIE